MKIIFLDIDGVLNCQSSKSRCQCFIGIDNKKVKTLRKIVEATNSKIVLCSSWKSEWEHNKNEQKELANYLDRKLNRENLFILDKTNDNGWNRGQGIIDWMKNKSIESFVIIDDEIFEDYEPLGLIDKLVKTSFYDNNGGLQEEHVKLVIKILNR